MTMRRQRQAEQAAGGGCGGFRDLLGGVGRDLRFSLREMVRRPGFMLIVVMMLAIGIGANAAIFSVLKGVALRELPYPEADRVVAVWETPQGERSYQPFSAPDYFDMREQNRSFEEIGLYRNDWINLAGEGGAVRVSGVRCTASVLRALGVSPALGRLFTEEEEIEGNHKVALLGAGLWSRRFGADPGILGESIVAGGESYTVIGVMPDAYEFPRAWTTVSHDPEIWVPILLPREEAQRGWHRYAAVGRLGRGVSVESAEADLQAIAARLTQAHPDTNARTSVWIDPLMRRSLGGVRTFLLILLGVVGLVLLIACANVASMLLAKGTTRANELAIRASMGASRGRLIRQLMTESLLLSAIGGLAAALLAVWGVGAIRGLIPATIPRVQGIRVDGGVLLFSLLVTAAATLVFGLAPALFAARSDLAQSLREGRGSLASGRGTNRFLRALVTGQLATAFVLANGAALLIMSHLNVMNLPKGFDPDRVLVAGLSTTGPEYEETEQRVALWDRLLERIAALPGVEHAAATNKLPLRGGNNGHVLVEGETYDPEAERPLVEYSYVTPDYFDAIGISLLSGRLLEENDARVSVAGEDRIAVVNQALADRYWPGESALGKRIRSNSNPPEWIATVVGVVENVRQWGLEYPPLREIYFPHSVELWPYTRLVVRASRDPLSLVPALRRAVLEIDDRLPLAGIRTMDDFVSDAASRRRFSMLLVALFAGTALLLGTAGIYGVMSYYVSQRTHEIGVRVALGADRGRVMRLFLGQGLRLALLGSAIGLVGSLASSGLTRNMVFGISPLHPGFLIGGVLFMTAVALAAIAAPVVRATRVDPNRALRAE